MRANLTIGIGFILLGGVLAFLSVKGVLGDGWLDKGDKIGSIIACLVGIWVLIHPFASDEIRNSPQVLQEGSDNIQLSGISVQGHLVLGKDITTTASHGGIVVNNTGSGPVSIGVSEERFQRLSEELGVTGAALKNFFHILEQREVPPGELDSQLRAIAKRYHELLEKWKVFNTDDPTIVTLKQEASQALEQGDFARVEQLLNQASERDVEAAKQLQETATKRLLSAAAYNAEIGTLKMIQLAYHDAATYFRQAADLVPQGAPLTRADYLNGWGAVSMLAGDYADARYPLDSALQIREHVLGPEHPDVALSLSNLATLHVKQDQYEQAEPLVRRALHIDEKALEPKHPQMAGHLEQLATVYQQRGKYDEAEPLYERALKIHEEVLGPEHPDVAIDLNNLGILYYRQHKYDDSVSAHQRALKIDKKVLGPDHPSIARDLNNLAVAYAALGKVGQAEPRHQRAINLAETILGPEHPNVMSYLKAYANTLRKVHRNAEAEQLEARIRDILNKCARTEGIIGPVSWRITALQATKKMIDGLETPAYSFVLVLKELHGIGITFGGTKQLIHRQQVGSASGEQTAAWRLLPNGEVTISLFFARPCQDIEAEPCYERGLVPPLFNLMLMGMNDEGQSVQLPLDIIFPALP